MPAAMTPLKAALVVASIIATRAQDGQFVSEDETDEIVLLQGSIQEKSAAKRSSDALTEQASEYNLPESFACSNQEAAATKISAAPMEPTENTAIVEDYTKSSSLTSEASQVEPTDPPGASTLRAILELLIVLIVLDGARRLHLQKQDNTRRQKVADSIKEKEAAAEAAWVEMVTAASAADVPRFEKALACGPSVTRSDEWSCTPLHFAAASGSLPIASELLKRGAEVDALDASEETPLHFAARSGHHLVCDLLLEAGANIDAVNLQDMTPLVVAGHCKQDLACSLLADRGAGVAGLSDEQLPQLVVCQLVRKVFAA